LPLYTGKALLQHLPYAPLSLTFGLICFGMVRSLSTHKDAASNLGRFTDD
jgi:hypothetical protein